MVASLVERTAAVLDANPLGYLDDSTHGIGRYDIYAADVWLFTEPLAGHLGARWPRVRAAPSNWWMPWPATTARPSLGAFDRVLGIALTVELAAFAAAQLPGATPAGGSDGRSTRPDGYRRGSRMG